MSSGSDPRPLRALVFMLLGGAAAYGLNRVLAERNARREAELAPHPFVLRRESLLDISDSEDPRQETVLVAEGLDISDLELDDDIIEEFVEPDPDERNTTATIAGHDDAFAISEEEMAAHEAAVVAEAERIEHEHAESESRATEAATQELTNTDVEDTPDTETATDSTPTADELVEEDNSSSQHTEPGRASRKKGKRKAKRAARNDLGADATASPNPAEDDLDDSESDDEAPEAEAETETATESADSDTVAWIPPISGECPLSHPIKARYATGRYHMPNTTSYSKIVADCCYATAAEAEADGFSESRW